MDIFVTKLRKAMFMKGWRQVDLKKALGETLAKLYKKRGRFPALI